MATLIIYYPSLGDVDDDIDLPTAQVAYYNHVSPKTLRNIVHRGLYPKPEKKKTPQSRDFWKAGVVKREMQRHGPLGTRALT